MWYFLFSHHWGWGVWIVQSEKKTWPCRFNTLSFVLSISFFFQNYTNSYYLIFIPQAHLKKYLHSFQFRFSILIPRIFHHHKESPMVGLCTAVRTPGRKDGGACQIRRLTDELQPWTSFSIPQTTEDWSLCERTAFYGVVSSQIANITQFIASIHPKRSNKL